MTFTITAQKHGSVAQFCQRCVPHDQVSLKCGLLANGGYINILALTEDERRLSYDEWSLEQKRDFEVGVCTVAGLLFILAVACWLCYSWLMRLHIDEPRVYVPDAAIEKAKLAMMAPTTEAERNEAQAWCRWQSQNGGAK